MLEFTLEIALTLLAIAIAIAFARSSSISSTIDSSCESSNNGSDKKKAKDQQRSNRFKVGSNAELSTERDGEATSERAGLKILLHNPVLFNTYESNYHDGKIPSWDTTGIDRNFLARHSTDPSLPQSSFVESYDMPPINENSNDWNQHSISSNIGSSSLWSLHCLPAPERSRSVLGNAYLRGSSSRYRDPMPVNYQPVTSMMGQFPSASGFSQGIDSFNWDENLPRNKRQTSFSSGGDLFVGNETCTASPSLGVRPLAPAVRYPAVTAPNFSTTTWQFSSSRILGSAAPVTSTYDVLSSHGQECMVDFNRYWPSCGDTQANSGLTSSEMVHLVRQQENLRSHGPSNYQQESSFAFVSPRDPSLVSLQLAENERERRQREVRERTERERIERMERELEEQRERETRVRENRTTEESLPIQDTPQWQCNHYQRRCSVKFPCCRVFYPCHQCHNLSGTCPGYGKKARHATHVKCRNCGWEEEVSIFCILGILSDRSSLIAKHSYKNQILSQNSSCKDPMGVRYM